MKIYPIILSGGSGTRLWPLSRKQYPKQYLPLTGEQTMLQVTLQRLNGLEHLAAPIIICKTEHRFLLAEQLREIGIHDATILLEPVGKNTAPAIAVAAHYVNEIREKRKGEECDQLLVLSSDHQILDVPAFHQAIESAVQQAAEEKLVTFGIVPTEPNTGYGYIKTDRCSGEPLSSVEKIVSFNEKPDNATAQQYLSEGGYLWNSGMFLFRTDVLLQQLTQYAPDIVEVSRQSVDSAVEDLDFLRLSPFPMNLEPLSIDHALMEKTNKAVVVPLDVGWSDVGSWAALYETADKDSNNNSITGDVLTESVSHCYIHADHHMVVAIGVEKLVIVDTPDATLVSTLEGAQQVKQVVERLQQQNRCEGETHRKIYRPWGWYDSIDRGARFQVKRICVNPGASLSLQKHYHRAEHWIVVKGTAKVTHGDKQQLLRENQSTFIPVGTLHRLENPGKLPLEMIEVQSGEYLGEDDIERFEDTYGRVDS